MRDYTIMKDIFHCSYRELTKHTEEDLDIFFNIHIEDIKAKNIIRKREEQKNIN